MNIAIDAMLVAVFLTCFIIGWVKGFVKTVMSLASSVIAGFGAWLLYTVPAGYIYSKLLLPKITSIIESAILSNSAGMTASELFLSRPQFFVDILNKFSTVIEVESFYRSGDAVTLTDICEFMAAPLARNISNILSFFLVFIVLLIALHLLTLLLDRICKLPVLKSANKFLGISAGVLMGLLLVWLLSAVAAAILPSLSTAYPDVVSPTVIEDSIVLKLFCNFNPLTLFK